MIEEENLQNAPDMAGEPTFQVIGTPAPSDEPVEEPAIAANEPGEQGSGKPVVCLMGEFSAGKSTLTNFLIQTSALPVNVTATQLPPVWISKGDQAPYRVGLDGGEYGIDLERIEDVSVEDTSHIRIFHNSPLLDECDLIDMPGISDPNMDASVWQRVIPNADAVVWCTHATQAWRQSEAAVWSMLPSELYESSFLLLTRMDKILSDRDKVRVIKRVARETTELFKDLFPISLTQALAAGDDAEKLENSGAGPFRAALSELVGSIADKKQMDAEAEAAARIPVEPVQPMRVRPKPLAARERPLADRASNGLGRF